MDFSLNALGILCGTDKSELGCDYLRHYERSLSRFRDLPMNLIEIGVDDGNSVAMWARYFPKAAIVGIDIKEQNREYEVGSIKIEIGSQSDGAFIDAVMKKYPPTVIVDDGSHIASDIIFTLERAFPALLPGGCYIVEDLYFHRDSVKRGSAPMGAQDYILAYAKRLMDSGAHAGPLAGSIDRIEAIGSAAVIWKRERAAEIDFDILELLVRRRAAAGGRSAPMSLQRFADYVMQNNGSPKVAVRAARDAVAINPISWMLQATLAHALKYAGESAEAVEWYEKASSEAPDPWRTNFLEQRDRLLDEVMAHEDSK
jgi:tetratricopeptide (TPR) repeat protein